MSKLHQILAVEKDLEKQKKKITEETRKVLGEHHLFNGSIKTLHMFDEERKREEAAQSTETKVTTDVMSRLQYLEPFLSSHLDCVFRKEATNATAKANIEVDGEVLLKDVPATMLLALERELTNLRDVLKAVPTLQSGIDFIIDEDLPGKVYRTVTPIMSEKVEKTIEYRVAYEATDKHPADVREVPITKRVGEYKEIKRSGCVTSRKKAEMLDKLEKLIQSTKKARAKANDAKVVNIDSTKKLFDWIFE